LQEPNKSEASVFCIPGVSAAADALSIEAADKKIAAAELWYKTRGAAICAEKGRKQHEGADQKLAEMKA
jgi:hypothetical protein